MGTGSVPARLHRLTLPPGEANLSPEPPLSIQFSA